MTGTGAMTAESRHEISLADEAATVAFSRKIAAVAQIGDVIALSGGLGTGKSVFARGFVRGLAPDIDDVPSPTFTLVQIYETPAFAIHHFDLYRLERPEDAVELGIEDAFAEAVSLIEWPDRLGALLPSECLSVTLASVDDDDGARTATLCPSGDWFERLLEAGIG